MPAHYTLPAPESKPAKAKPTSPWALLILFFIIVCGGYWFYHQAEKTRLDRLHALQPAAYQQPANPPPVWVNGHYRKDGVFVPGHYRTAPDGDPSNNWSTYPNVNPYTGKQGRK